MGWAGGILADLKWTPTTYRGTQTQVYFFWNWTLRSILVSIDILREGPLGHGFGGLSSPLFPWLLPL